MVIRVNPNIAKELANMNLNAILLNIGAYPRHVKSLNSHTQIQLKYAVLLCQYGVRTKKM
jgi:hypothetical protein